MVLNLVKEKCKIKTVNDWISKLPSLCLGTKDIMNIDETGLFLETLR